MQTAYRDFFYSAQDGLRLHARIYGRPRADALPVVCLPGLTRNARDFHELALILSGRDEAGRQVICFDYRGRGRSEYDKNWKNYTVPTEAADVIAGLTALDVEHGAFIGTSRGGLIIMVLAALRPALLKKAVLNDVGPVTEGDGIAQIISYLTRAPRPQSWNEATEIIKTANTANFPVLTDADWERAAKAIYRDENGKPVPDFDPRLMRTLTGIDLNKPLPVLWPQFAGLEDIPLMTIRGENSKLLSPKTLAEMENRHPGMETVIVKGQGHAPFLETAGLPKIIGAFLDKSS